MKYNPVAKCVAYAINKQHNILSPTTRENIKAWYIGEMLNQYMDQLLIKEHKRKKLADD
ncbi:hypothetical protein KAR91_46580 [Candidatus Pacearchaeota archaeon]|nr:hypothetical protein [Candidatus Pacearchaeota archaeon]